MQVIATAGHVDHGKSTLVRALTGMEPDRYAEERRRGMTIDLGYAWTTLPGGSTVAFVDVPGHERFVTTMLAGVGPVPAAMLVVAADEGWMPQSAEHLDALTALGVQHGLLVISRSDLLDPSLALEEARARLTGTDLADVPAVAVSAVTGAGMDELRAALADLAAALPVPDPGADVRLWIDRSFTVRGAGTVVTGTLPAGTVRTGDELDLLGADGPRRVTVRGLQALGEPHDRVSGVARVAVNLRGVAREAGGRGDLLVTPGAFLVGDVVDVRLRAPHGTAADAGGLPAGLSLHAGSAAVPVRVRPLGADTARLRLARPLPLRIGDVVVLRDPGRRRIAAGAMVLDVAPPPLRRRGSGARRAAELATMDAVPDAAAELARRRVVRAEELVAMGVPRPQVTALAVPAAAGWLVDPAAAPSVLATLGAAVDAHDAADPLAPGLPTEAARRAADLPDARLLDALLAAADTPGLVHHDGRVSRSVAAGLPAAVRAGLDALRADLEAHPFAAPGADRLAELGLGPREIASLVRAGELLRLADGVVLLAGADDRAVDVLSGLGGDALTLSEVRQALGTTRRVAVPLMEHLGRTGRAVRTGPGGHRLRR
ncbi:selenocysteine-specific translation elongation factor [Pseudonocardia sp. N23]|uniref:selenocysteine-specific translation elongation factor n=1 Tax=Pseudonocardia sp. N23 TaxID=1987376 RepID=UPI000BFD19EE|nr:selenocysteine-specific translation elongation factor [Pseudonocardia sp. N23]GAY08640.1 selenocysteine-specific translation elongation factor [Pseudonocardia sp. N23]